MKTKKIKTKSEPKKQVFFLPVLREQLTVPTDPVFLTFFKQRLDDGIKVAFSIGGYDNDPRELFEVPEVCAWMSALFINEMPEALKTLHDGPPGRALVEACCNKTTKSTTGKLQVEVSPAWVGACLTAGVSP